MSRYFDEVLFIIFFFVISEFHPCPKNLCIPQSFNDFPICFLLEDL